MIVTLIQTRMGSKRLPGKCLKEINGISLTEYVILSSLKSECVDYTGIIYPKKDENSFREKFKNHDIFLFGGDENNVLKRYYDAVKELEKNKNVSHIVRLTADCPLLFFYPQIIDTVIQKHLYSNNDYTNNLDEYPSGVDVEVFTRKTLEKVYKKAKDLRDLEHVTRYIRENKKEFKTGEIKRNSLLQEFNQKWSIDSIEDFNKVSDLINFINLKIINFVNS